MATPGRRFLLPAPSSGLRTLFPQSQDPGAGPGASLRELSGAEHRGGGALSPRPAKA